MNAILISLLFPFLLGAGQFSPSSTPSNEALQNDDARRQCCTITNSVAVNGTYVILSYTACAGWFLSDDAQAFARACDKAYEAANIH